MSKLSEFKGPAVNDPEKGNTEEIDLGSILSLGRSSFQPVIHEKGFRCSQVIRKELANAEMTQKQLAEYLLISEAALSRRLSNETHAWKYSDLVRIQNFLGIDLFAALSKEQS